MEMELHPADFVLFSYSHRSLLCCYVAARCFVMLLPSTLSYIHIHSLYHIKSSVHKKIVHTFSDTNPGKKWVLHLKKNSVTLSWYLKSIHKYVCIYLARRLYLSSLSSVFPWKVPVLSIRAPYSSSSCLFAFKIFHEFWWKISTTEWTEGVQSQQTNKRKAKPKKENIKQKISFSVFFSFSL